MKPITQILAENLRAIRKQRGWTMDEAAKFAGISQPAWQRIETQLRWPTPGTVEKMAQALGVHASVLFAPELAWKAPDPTPDQALKVLAAVVHGLPPRR